MSKRPIVKLNLHDDLPPVELFLQPHQHAVLELALRFLVEVIESREYESLQNASVEAFAQMRTVLFGIQAQLRTATRLDEPIHFIELHLNQPERDALCLAIEGYRSGLDTEFTLPTENAHGKDHDELRNILRRIHEQIADE